MRRSLRRSVPLALLVAFPLAAHASTWQAIESLPGQRPVTLMVQDHPRVYFRVTPEAPLAVTVDGPARLRVVTRVAFPPGAKDEVMTYRVSVTEGGRALEENSTEASGSDEVRPAAGAYRVGKSRRLTADVPAGRHRLQVEVQGVPALLVRLQQGPPSRGGEPMISLTPIAAARSVHVIEDEKTIPYYSVMPNQPVRLRVVGPTTLELSSRLDFGSTMRGTVAYRLAVNERDRRLRVLDFRTTKATTASFPDLKDQVPSKLSRVTLPIGQGLHELEIALLSPASGAAEIHARIPQPAAGNEE